MSSRFILAAALAVVLAVLSPGATRPPAEAQAVPDAVNRAIQQIRALPGRTNFLVTEDGRELGSYQPDLQLGGGSQFKMFVALELKRQLEAGIWRWFDVVPLDRQWRVPGGVLTQWPEGSPITVMSYAGFMIQLSENTGTDAIIHLVGRNNVEALTGRNVPLLTTREFFQLKNIAFKDHLDRYRQADTAGRRQILAELDNLPVPDEGYTETPYALDVEWFFTPREYCGVIERVADMPIMSIASPIADKKDWARVAFKGGSEPGVIGTTTWMQAANGKTYCISSTWMNPDTVVDEAAYAGILKELAGALRQ